MAELPRLQDGRRSAALESHGCASSTLHERPSDIPPLWRDDRGPPWCRRLRLLDLTPRVYDFRERDHLRQLQRVGMLETPVLQAFRWRPPEIVAKTVDKASPRFNKLQHPIFVSY